MKNFILLETYNFPHEYLIIKMRLEQENIRYFFQNETMVGLLPSSSFAFGGIQLYVNLNDIDRAKEILDSFNNSSSHLNIV